MAEYPQYEGERPAIVSRETVDDMMKLLSEHGLGETARQAIARARGRTLGPDTSFRGLRPEDAGRAYDAATEIPVDKETINAIKEVLFDSGLHERSKFAADIVGMTRSPPDYHCPKLRLE